MTEPATVGATPGSTTSSPAHGARADGHSHEEFVDAQIRAVDAWIEARLDEFDPFSAKTPKGRYARRKAFAELAIYAYVRAHDPHSSRPDQLLRWVADHVNTERFRSLVLRHPKQFLLYSSPIVCARDAGLLVPEIEQAVERTLAVDDVWATERVPHRMLDLWNFCAAYGYPPRRLDVAQIVDHGIVGRMDPVAANLRDAYGWTHHMLFVHNFGVPTPAVSGRPLAYDERIPVVLTLCRFMAEDNTDVALELLYGLALQQQLDDVTRSAVLDWVAAKIDDHDGLIPGPIEQDDAGSDLPEEIDVDWYTHYHTRLVAASTLRYLRFYWTRPGPEPIAAELSADELVAVGEPLAALARYELPLGVAKAMDLADITGAAGPLVDAALVPIRRFLAHHTADGLGYWVDERAQHDATHGAGSFDETILGPMRELIGGWVDELLTSPAPAGLDGS